MTGLINVRTCELTGDALLWALEKTDGPLPTHAAQMQLPLGGQTVDDATGEHLIQKHCIWIEQGWSFPWLACLSGRAEDRQPGDTRAEAAARAVVHRARGETINVPKELMP